MSLDYLEKLRAAEIEEQKKNKKPNLLSRFLKHFFSEERNVFFIFFVNYAVTVYAGLLAISTIIWYFYSGKWVNPIDVWGTSDSLFASFVLITLPSYALIPIAMVSFYFIAWVIACLIKFKILLKVGLKMIWLLLISQWLVLLYPIVLITKGLVLQSNGMIIVLLSMLFTSVIFWVIIEYLRKRRIKKDRING